jgi:hypothetical protein
MRRKATRKSGNLRRPKTKLGLPDLDHSKSAVLNSLRSPESKRGYRHAIDEFIQWYCSGTLALDAEEAGSPRDEAIDAVSTRPREDQPNEDQNV